MTKAARILELYAEGKSTREIANIVGCRQEYVRVVARQRKGSSTSEIDRRYNESPLGIKTRNKRAPRYLAYIRTRQDRLRATADLGAANREGRHAYRKARLMGKSVREAMVISNSARYRIIAATGDGASAKKAARNAYHAAKADTEASC